MTQKNMINTDSDKNGFLHREITDKILKCFYKVYNTLGYGFLEKVYERAMMIEFDLIGLKYVNQSSMEVLYFGYNIGYFNSDFLVEEKVIVELKARETLIKDDPLQLINYLKSSYLEVGLLLNFGKKPEAKRMIFTNDRKKSV